MKQIVTILFLSLFIVNGNAFAQRLTESQKRSLERRVEDKVNEFQFYLSQLGDKESTDKEVKDNAYQLTIKLFIGECQEYRIIKYNSRNEPYSSLQPAVRMRTSSVNRPNVSTPQKMTTYLNKLRNNQTYSQIEITSADAVRVDNIYREGNQYVCMAYFCQKYIGWRDNRPVYSDITTKKVKVYIQAIEIPKSDGTTETIWNALLGDIYVISTERLNVY